MGYVFDAIQRDDDPRREADAPQAPPPREPAAQSAEPDPLFELRYHPQPSNAPLRPDKVDAAGLDDRLVALTDPASPMAEEYRAIRTSPLARWQNRSHLVHTITSATPQEGKTITSVNLGLTFAELRSCRTVVVEADLRLPTFDKLLHLAPRVGLIDYLRGEAELDQIVARPLEGHPLHIIAAGGRTQGDAVQLLSSQRMEQLLLQLRQRYDHVIVDTPPVVDLADAGIVGSHSDDVLLVVRMNRTPRPLVEQAIRTLQSYNAPVAGSIATDQRRRLNKYYYYRYGYRYHDGDGSAVKRAA